MTDLLPIAGLPSPPAPPEPPKVTEATMIEALRTRYSQVSQGSSIRYAIASHVRNAAGFDASRECDFMALDLWPAQGLHLHGHEVKVSRSDWLCELRDPSKAEAFRRYCDRWWLVVSHESIVKPGELPDGWGLMVRSGDTVRVRNPAPTLTPEPLPRTFLASFARSIQKTSHRALMGPA